MSKMAASYWVSGFTVLTVGDRSKKTRLTRCLSVPDGFNGELYNLSRVDGKFAVHSTLEAARKVQTIDNIVDL